MTWFSIISTVCLCTQTRMLSGFFRRMMLIPLLDKNTLVI